MPARVVLGTGLLSGRTTPVVAERLVRTALDAGVDRIDTARAYGDGETEWFLGRVLRGRPDVTVVTKAGLGPLTRSRSSALKWRVGSRVLARLPAPPPAGEPDGPAPVARVDRQALLASIDLSRAALGRDRLDLLLLHEVDARTFGDEVADVLDGLVADGRIAAWGVGTRRESLAELLVAGRRLGSLVQTSGGPLVAPVPATGAPLSVHSVLGAGARRLGRFLDWLPASAHRATWERLVGPLDARRTAGDAVLRVAAATPGVDAVLVSSRDPASLRRSITAASTPESADRLQALAPVFDAFRSEA